MRILLLVLLVGLAGCGGGRPKEVQEFKRKLPEYLSLEMAMLPHNSRGYIKPKIVPIDLSTGDVDDEVYLALPEELRAKEPKEVNTVLLLEWRKAWRGGGKNVITQESSSGTNFYAWEGIVVAVDVSGSQPVASYAPAYTQTLPEYYRGYKHGGKFAVVKENDGYFIETASPKRQPSKMLNGVIAGKAPMTGHSGENVGERPVGKVIELVKSLPTK